MNKKILSVILAVTLITPVTAQAASLQNRNVAQPTIAILDTALDTSLPIFKGRILFEACVTQWSTCPNGLAEMEGPNSSTLKPDWISKNGFDHGTQMASLAVATNPNVNIVFVRIVGANSKGLRQATGEATVYNALDWVIRNKDRFNIQAVSMSQGHSSLRNPDPNYCPKTPITEGKINTLMNAGIPVFFPTDFFAQGTTRATTVGNVVINVAGTSASTVIAATQWATIKSAKPTLSYQQIYELISKTATPTYNSQVKSGKLINLQGALNG